MMLSTSPEPMTPPATRPHGSTIVPMFERFTDRARRVVVLAQEEARLLNHNYIGTEHILLGLIHEGEGVAAKALQLLEISLEAVRAEVEETIGPGIQTPTGHIPFTPRAKRVLELALGEARQLGHDYIGTEHLLLALIREGEGVAAQVLTKLGADLDRVRAEVVAVGESRHESEPATTSACSFCSRDLAAATHYLRGESGAICDACITAAAGALAQAPPDRPGLFLPPP
jgi:ATP-dependent Clp protease ATP-binding subunit ClpC